MSRRLIIAVDFDGTIVENAMPGIGTIKPNCVKLIKALKSQGAEIILWTCRDGDLLEAAISCCKENDIPIDYINQNSPNLPFKTSSKIFADFYIDDRALNILDGVAIISEVINRYNMDAFIVTPLNSKE